MPANSDEQRIAIKCPAKINLTLAVGAPREDGLHPIASVMTTVELSDVLTLSKLKAGPSTFDRVFDPACPRPGVIDWPIERDLACRAHALIEAEAGKPLAVHCKLTKMIPTGAGLGGGSSNAAGMLVGLRDLFRLPITDHRLVALGCALGSDVGFAVSAALGCGSALVMGVGDMIEPLPAVGADWVVLLFPEGACPTRRVYNAFDEMTPTPRTSTELEALAADWRRLTTPPEPINDLAPAAIRVCPAIGSVIDAMAAHGHAAQVTGSGSALFVLAHDAARADKVLADARHEGIATYHAFWP